jgi:hypothetical protein
MYWSHSGVMDWVSRDTTTDLPHVIAGPAVSFGHHHLHVTVTNPTESERLSSASCKVALSFIFPTVSFVDVSPSTCYHAIQFSHRTCVPGQQLGSAICCRCLFTATSSFFAAFHRICEAPHGLGCAAT